MIFKIEAKKNLFINEWDTIVTNDLDHDIAVDLGHTELMVKTITIKEEKTEIPKVFREN